MTNDSNQPNAPDPLAPKGLGAAFDKFKDVFNKSMQEPKSRPKGKILIAPEYDKPVVGHAIEHPTKFCDVCGTVTEKKIVAMDSALSCKTCDRCQTELDAGAVALMSPDRRFAFVYSKTLADSIAVGENTQRIKISNEVMDQVEKKFKEG